MSTWSSSIISTKIEAADERQAAWMFAWKAAEVSSAVVVGLQKWSATQGFYQASVQGGGAPVNMIFRVWEELASGKPEACQK
jgi:hypothetical protein